VKSLNNEIINFLKTVPFDVIVNVRKANSKSTPIYPLITVSEIENSTRTLLQGIERYANIGFQINIFSKDVYPSSGEDIALSIAQVLDTYILEQYGFKRTSFISLPDVNDLSVSRITIRYSGVLDTINDYIYQ